MISPRDISVVVQGPVTGTQAQPEAERLTQRCLASIRASLPGAQVILSTWAEADVSGLSYDVLVQNADPGGVNCTLDTTRGPQVFNNLNRQIISTRAGLLAADRPYAIKVRSDMQFSGTGFLDYFGKYRARAPEWRILEERVVTSTHYARNPRRHYKYPFHPSDWFFFGRHADVLNIWDVPLAPEPETSRWFDSHPAPAEGLDYFLPPTVYRYTVEQYVWTSFLRKYAPLPFDHRSDLEHDAIEVSELTLANNLVMAEPDHLQVRFVKYPMSARDAASLYTEGDWMRMYRRHCDPRVAVRPDVELWRRQVRDRVWVPVAAALASPSSASPGLRGASESWARRFPASFRLAKGAYVSLARTVRALRPRS